MLKSHGCPGCHCPSCQVGIEPSSGHAPDVYLPFTAIAAALRQVRTWVFVSFGFEGTVASGKLPVRRGEATPQVLKDWQCRFNGWTEDSFGLMFCLLLVQMLREELTNEFM